MTYTFKILGKFLLFLILLLIVIIGEELIAYRIIGYPPVLQFVMHELPFRGKSFKPGAWEAAGSCEGLSDWKCVEKEMSCPRGGMVYDLTKNYLIVETTTRSEVLALLGQNKYTVEIDSKKCKAYSLGMCSGLGIDYDSLYICFDENEIISSTGHIQH